MSDAISLSAIVPPEMGHQRFDLIASQLFPSYSRARLQGWIKSGELTVNGATAKPKDKLITGDRLLLNAHLPIEGSHKAENIPLDILFEDDSLLIINKPPGLVVHPAAGNWEGTLLNALLFHYPSLETLPRAGIVHRLDKDTSGLMVVAKTIEAQLNLVQQLQERSVSRQYEAITQGIPHPKQGTINAPIGRHPSQRVKMAVVSGYQGKEAITHYQTLSTFEQHAHIQVKLETGRTHQIRVHMAHLGFPLIGDPLYLTKTKIPKQMPEPLQQQLMNFPRQALHAKSLGLIHPVTEQPLHFVTPLPDDMLKLLALLSDQVSDQTTKG
jgi:23S rRNA pseudouridine1911/1915/1917 synthase